jgi:hypothetical protein
VTAETKALRKKDTELRRKIASAPELRPDPVRINKTEAALVSRGVDFVSARKLRKYGWTFSKLQQSSPGELRALGIPRVAIHNIHGSGRPSIPFEPLIQTLIANRFSCCVCHDPTKSVIVHHIQEWAKSHDHQPSNLAVLCLNCHDAAHTTRQLTQNLDAKKLARSKVEWEKLVAETNTAAVLEASRHDYDAWWYFNHFRIFQIAESLKVRLASLPGYKDAFADRLITKKGWPRSPEHKQMHMYNSGDGMILYSYVRAVFHEVVGKLTLFNASDDMDRSLLGVKLKPGDFVFVQGHHRFARTNDNVSGPGQMRTGTRQAHSVRFRYAFDGWDATSSSAWSMWLSGSQDAGSVIRITKLATVDGVFLVKGTVLGICHALPNQKTRQYSPALYRTGVMILDDDE